MHTVCYKNYPAPSLDKKEILRYAGCKDVNERVLALVEECLLEIEDKLTYRVCYAEFPLLVRDGEVDLIFAKLTSTTLQKAFADCGSYILFAATVGLEMDRLIAKYSCLSPAKALLLQAIGAERIESLCNHFCAELQSDGKHIRPRVSPGYGDIPLEIQRDIFSTLDCPRKIGLTLNSSMLMTPTKSVTAFIGVYQ